MALTTNTISQDDGVSDMAVGQVVTDAGAAADTTFNVGFVPRYIMFLNRTDRIRLEWFEGMAANTAIRTVAAGTVTLDVSSGLTVGTSAAGTANSFTVKAADIPASKSCSFVVQG